MNGCVLAFMRVCTVVDHQTPAHARPRYAPKPPPQDLAGIKPQQTTPRTLRSLAGLKMLNKGAGLSSWAAPGLSAPPSSSRPPHLCVLQMACVGTSSGVVARGPPAMGHAARQQRPGVVEERPSLGTRVRCRRAWRGPCHARACAQAVCLGSKEVRTAGARTAGAMSALWRGSPGHRGEPCAEAPREDDKARRRQQRNTAAANWPRTADRSSSAACATVGPCAQLATPEFITPAGRPGHPPGPCAPPPMALRAMASCRSPVTSP